MCCTICQSIPSQSAPSWFWLLAFLSPAGVGAAPSIQSGQCSIYESPVKPGNVSPFSVGRLAAGGGEWQSSFWTTLAPEPCSLHHPISTPQTEELQSPWVSTYPRLRPNTCKLEWNWTQPPSQEAIQCFLTSTWSHFLEAEFVCWPRTLTSSAQPSCLIHPSPLGIRLCSACLFIYVASHKWNSLTTGKETFPLPKYLVYLTKVGDPHVFLKWMNGLILLKFAPIPSKVEAIDLEILYLEIKNKCIPYPDPQVSNKATCLSSFAGFCCPHTWARTWLPRLSLSEESSQLLPPPEQSFKEKERKRKIRLFVCAFDKLEQAAYWWCISIISTVWYGNNERFYGFYLFAKAS